VLDFQFCLLSPSGVSDASLALPQGLIGLFALARERVRFSPEFGVASSSRQRRTVSRMVREEQGFRMKRAFSRETKPGLPPPVPEL